MSVVGMFEGVFVESRVCRNQDYFQAVFNFPEEVFGNVISIEQMDRPRRTNILCETKRQGELLKLNPGQKYKLLCSVAVNQSNERNGKVYPASVNLNIIKVQS